MADFEEAGDNDVLQKVRKDFDGKSVSRPTRTSARNMDELIEQAIEQIKKSG